MIFFVSSKHAAHICTCQHILCCVIKCVNTVFGNSKNPLQRLAAHFHANVLQLITRLNKSILSRHSCLSTILFLHVPAHSVNSLFLHCACKSLDRATVPFRIGRGFLPCDTSYAEMSQDRKSSQLNRSQTRLANLGRRRFQSLSLHHPVSCCWNLDQNWQAGDRPLWNLNGISRTLVADVATTVSHFAVISYLFSRPCLFSLVGAGFSRSELYCRRPSKTLGDFFNLPLSLVNDTFEACWLSLCKDAEALSVHGHLSRKMRKNIKKMQLHVYIYIYIHWITLTCIHYVFYICKL